MIITEYKYFTIKIKNQINYDNELEVNPDRFKTYKLPYQIVQYEQIKNQDKKHINRLRKSGVKIITKKKKINNQVFSEYFKVYAKVDKDFKYRQSLVNKILGKEVFKKEYESNKICEIENFSDKEREKDKIIKKIHTSQVNNTENFIQYQNRKNVEKQTDDELTDEYLILLDTISSYLMCDNKLANCMNSNYQNKEVNFNKQKTKAIERYKKRLYTSTPKQKKEEYEKWKKKNKLQVKRWKKSKTYKLNNLYSYTYDKDIQYWDWIKKDWNECKSSLNMGIKRLIDPLKPHTVKWCLVDINNNFKFNNKEFMISKTVKSYEVSNKAEYINGELNNFTNDAQMEQILSFYIPHEDKYYFFDENIDRLNNKDVLKIS